MTGWSFVFQLLVAVVAVILCVASVSTSRGRHTSHVAYASVAWALVAAAVLGAALAMLSDLVGERRADLWMALSPLATVVLCLLPLWRARQARRMRNDAMRYRQRAPRAG